MATMHVSLPDVMKAWVDRQSESGRYGNASDYVRDLIRRDQARQQAIGLVQRAIDEGLASGAGVALDPAAFKRSMRARNIGG